MAGSQDARGGCKSKPGTRQGSRTQTAVTHRKQAGSQVTEGQVFLEEKLLTNVFDFKYLGFTFSADGDFRQAISVRMAQAKARFSDSCGKFGVQNDRDLPNLTYMQQP